MIENNPHEMSRGDCITSYGRGEILNVLAMKTAIWSRVTGVAGQYWGGLALQPEVIPSAASRSIQAAAQWLVGTSWNTPLGSGGE